MLIFLHLITVTVLSFLLYDNSVNGLTGILFGIIGAIFLFFAFLTVASSEDGYNEKTSTWSRFRISLLFIFVGLLIMAAMFVYHANSELLVDRVVKTDFLTMGERLHRIGIFRVWMIGIFIFQIAWMTYGIILTVSWSIPRFLKAFFWMGMLTGYAFFVHRFEREIMMDTPASAILIFIMIVISLIALAVTVTCLDPTPPSSKKEDESFPKRSTTATTVGIVGIFLAVAGLKKLSERIKK